MSRVLNVALWVGLDDSDSELGGREDELTALMSKLRSGGSGYSWKLVSRIAGGNKHLEVDVYLAALNFGDVAEIAGLIAGWIEWPHPKHVALVWQDQNDEGPTFLPLWPMIAKSRKAIDCADDWKERMGLYERRPYDSRLKPDNDR